MAAVFCDAANKQLVWQSFRRNFQEPISCSYDSLGRYCMRLIVSNLTAALLWSPPTRKINLVKSGKPTAKDHGNWTVFPPLAQSEVLLPQKYEHIMTSSAQTLVTERETPLKIILAGNKFSSNIFLTNYCTSSREAAILPRQLRLQKQVQFSWKIIGKDRQRKWISS